MPVSSFRMMIFTPGKIAPVPSLTVPEMAPVVT
jgi:hypothetical protein